MTMLLIQTQVLENYGTAEDPYWKPKGGGDYVVKNVDECDMVDTIACRAQQQIEQDNEMFREWVIGWKIVADDYLTEFERSQLEFEGKITYPANEVIV